jgi:hypothetical protein
MVGCMDGWMVGWLDGWMVLFIYSVSLANNFTKIQKFTKKKKKK